MTIKPTSAKPVDLLATYFSKPSTDQFWHHLMKYKKTQNTYQEKLVEARVQEIIKRKGSNSFTWPSHHGWTPAHVAVLADNPVGLQFLKAKGALASNIIDWDGYTPIGLAMIYHPELVKYFEDLQMSPSIVKKPSLDLFFETHCASKTLKPIKCSPNSDDFGIEIKTLMFAAPSSGTIDMQEAFSSAGLKIDHIAKNMAECAERFGFKLLFSKYQYALRDNLIRLPNGKVLSIAISENTPQALQRTLSRSLRFRNKASFQTNHLFFKGQLGAAHSHICQAGLDLAERFGANIKEVPSLRFYMEGGNHYLMTNTAGVKVALLGEETLSTALSQMREDGIFNDPFLDLKPSVAFYRKEFFKRPDFLKMTLEEMYVQGFLAKGPCKEKGLISPEEISSILQLCDSEKKNGCCDSSLKKNPYLAVAEQFGYYRPLDFSKLQLKDEIEGAATYLAQMEMTKMIIAASFSVDLKQLVFVPQLDYHLDIFLRPGPDGSIFVQDYSLCVKLLNEILSQSDALGLSADDIRMLKRYRDTADQLERELGPLSRLVKKKVEEAELRAIPAPGVFYDASPHLLNPEKPHEALTFNLNFLNAITGWSSSSKSHFYLATGAGVGDRLGGVLMSAFEQFLKAYQPDVQVCFLGYDPENKSDFSEGMRWLNRMGSQLGPHCLSFALETKARNS